MCVIEKRTKQTTSTLSFRDVLLTGFRIPFVWLLRLPQFVNCLLIQDRLVSFGDRLFTLFAVMMTHVLLALCLFLGADVTLARPLPRPSDVLHHSVSFGRVGYVRRWQMSFLLTRTRFWQTHNAALLTHAFCGAECLLLRRLTFGPMRDFRCNCGMRATSSNVLLCFMSLSSCVESFALSLAIGNSTPTCISTTSFFNR